jgi:hypothetical protein
MKLCLYPLALDLLLVLAALLLFGSPVGAADLESSWQDLASRDGTRAYQAVWILVGHGDRAVLFLRERLSPAEGEVDRVRQLLADLDNDRFKTREAASRELERLGEAVEAVLRKTLAETQSVEVRNRVEALLSRINSTSPLAGSAEELRTVRAIQVLEYIGTRESRTVLMSLARGMPGARTTRDAEAALERLSRPPKP